MAQSKAFDSNAESWPKFSGFEPFTPGSTEIRLLRLEGTASGSELSYTMRHADFTLTTFAALSYSWGAPVPDVALKYIIINGQIVYIRPIIHAFLVTLAAHDTGVSLWIDAVCINQKDTNERNNQIAMMGEIFGSAEKVFVWLGPGDDDTNYAFEHIMQSKPQTPFDQRQFQPAVEKIFRGSYWTRRWVIQEFALAKDLYIACGPHMTTWKQVLQSVNDSVLENDERALQVMNNFKGLKALGARQDLSLLDLLSRFQASRCIDRRDKAFALRGIANDGSMLRPDYNESVADVYFRTLSLQPMQTVLPRTIGYQWPHRAASQLLDYLLVNEEDFLGSLFDKPSDQLYVALEYAGAVRSVEGYSQDDRFWLGRTKAQVSGEPPMILLGSDGVTTGQMIYSLQSSPVSPQGVYLAFGSDLNDAQPADILFNNSTEIESPSELTANVYMVWQIIMRGITRCIRNSDPRLQKVRVLCHINRSVLLLLWLLEEGKEPNFLGEIQRHSEDHSYRAGYCRCRNDNDTDSVDKPDSGRDPLFPLEIMPAVRWHSESEDIWARTASRLWLSDEDIDMSATSLRSLNPFRPTDELVGRKMYFMEVRRSGLAYAAQDGLEQWVRYIIKEHPEEVFSRNSNNQPPFWWAMSSGNLNVIKLLLDVGEGTHNGVGVHGSTPLIRAIQLNQTKVVEVLAASEKIDVNCLGSGHRRPLSQAASEGHVGPVKALLASDRIEPDGEDLDGLTPIRWATKLNHTEIAELLLATGKINVNRKDIQAGRTALSYAAENGNLRIVELLLSVEGIDPDPMDNQRWTPLRYASAGGHLEVYNRLLATNKVKLNVPVPKSAEHK